MGKSQSKSRLSKKSPDLHAKAEFDYLHQVAMWGFMALLFLPPYFRGLFFSPEQQIALVFATLVFWLAFLWCWLQNDHKFLRGPLEYFAFALPVIFIISTITAVNKGLAINEVVNNILYFLAFWSASRLIRNIEDVHRVLHVIYISAIGVALAGLATATGYMEIKDGFLLERIYSTFQYPNALASYLAAVFLIGSYLWYRSIEFTALPQTKGISLPELFSPLNRRSYLYAWGNFILLAVLIGTKSRGGLLVFGLVFLIYLIALGAKGRLITTCHAAFNGLVALVCISKFIPLAANQQHVQAWLWLIAGLVAVLAWQLLYRLIELRYLSLWAEESSRYNITFGAFAGLGALVGSTLLYSQSAIWGKIKSFEFLRNAFERMYFVNDALEMIKERPFLGWGGGGWKEAYRSFQEYLYNSNEVHSYYLQLGVETGLVGLFVVAGIFLSFISYIYRIYKANPGVFQTVWVLAAAFLVIAVHALIDFDLSLSALALILWVIFGTVNSLYTQVGLEQKESRQQQPRLKDLPKSPLALGTILAIVIVALPLFLLQANTYAKEGSQYLQVQQIEKGLVCMEKAASNNPFSADYPVLISQIYRVKSEHDKSIEQAKRAVELSLYSSQCRINLADAYIAAGKYELGLEQAERALELSPFQLQWYESLADRYIVVGYRLLEEGHQDEARANFQKAVELPDQITTRMENVPERYIIMWKDGPMLTPTESILLATGMARYQLGLYDEAEMVLGEVVISSNKEIKGKALLWLAIMASKTGQTSKAEDFLEQAEALFPEIRSDFERIKMLPRL